MHCRVARFELSNLLKNQGKKSFDALMQLSFDSSKKAWAEIMKTEEHALLFNSRALLPFINKLKKEIADAIVQVWGRAREVLHRAY